MIGLWDMVMSIDFELIVVIFWSCSVNCRCRRWVFR